MTGETFDDDSFLEISSKNIDCDDVFLILGDEGNVAKRVYEITLDDYYQDMEYECPQ